MNEDLSDWELVLIHLRKAAELCDRQYRKRHCTYESGKWNELHKEILKIRAEVAEIVDSQ